MGWATTTVLGVCLLLCHPLLSSAGSSGGSSSLLLFNETFTTTTPDSRLQWINPPSTWESGKGMLRVQGDKGSDWWRLSYYNPPFIHETGHVLGIKTSQDVVVETTFSLEHKSQFDQAGLMIHLDNYHWIKVGLEFADGKTRLSSVITNNFSQWAVQDWEYDPVTIRLYKTGRDVVAEVYDPHLKQWKFFFIGRIEGMDQGPATIGAHIASPVEKAAVSKFYYLSVSQCPTDTPCYHHNADDLPSGN